MHIYQKYNLQKEIEKKTKKEIHSVNEDDDTSIEEAEFSVEKLIERVQLIYV